MAWSSPPRVVAADVVGPRRLLDRNVIREAPASAITDRRRLRGSYECVCVSLLHTTTQRQLPLVQDPEGEASWPRFAW